MSQLNVDTVRNRTGTNGGPTFDKGLTVSAGTTAYVYGNLQVDGTETIINTETLNVADKTVGIGSTSNASNTTADGAGIEIYAGSGGNKTLTWNNTGNTWTFAPTDVTVTVGAGVTIYGDTGIVSSTTLRADTLYGNGANLTGMASTEFIDAASVTSSGIVTATAGVIVTAGRGVQVTAGGVNVDAGIGTFDAGVKVAGNGIDVSAGGLDITGITTLASPVNVGTGASIHQLSSNQLIFGTNTAEALKLTSTQGMVLNNGELIEKVKISSSALNADQVCNLDDGMVHYRTSNLGGSGGTSLILTSSVGLATAMSTGDMMSFTLVHAVNTTGNYVDHVNIDHIAVTENWVGGSAPSAGGGSGVDIYTFNIIKKASGTGDTGFTVIGNHIKTS